MSEELLNALIHLFAIIIKQNNGPSLKESDFVRNFLSHQLDTLTSEKYFNLFNEYSLKKNNEKRVSVTDSVSIIGIAKKINKILTQKQKIVVLIRIFELVKADPSGFDLKYSIIETLADVFNISSSDFKSVKAFVLKTELENIEKSELLIIGKDNKIIKAPQDEHKLFDANDKEGCILVLRIQSVNLFLFTISGVLDVKLNRNKIPNDTVHVFASGGVIQANIGKPLYYQEVVSHFALEVSFLPLSFNVNNVEYEFPNGNAGLHEINISEGSGKLIGIMGSSGSGKTTLLNIISGIQKPTSGEVLLNGINIHSEGERIKGTIGFVSQDDLLIEELTVFENLFFNAKFCFANLSEKEIENRVLNLLDLLGLAESRDLKVGSVLNKVISGGQRKRLNIALELIREPSILFLDEPTSGLSSKDSENIMKLLNQLALRGKLIFLVIHQPNSDIYKLFDKVLLLDKGGYLIYYGNAVEAISYFKKIDHWVNDEFGECPSCGNINSESIFNIIEAETINEFGSYTGLRKISPKEWFGFFKSRFTINLKKDVHQTPPNSLRTPSKLRQLIIYLKRDYFSKISNKQYLIVNIFEAPLLAFILSFIIRYINNADNTAYIYRENSNIPAYIFMTIIVFSFMGISISAEEIFRDSKILKREKFLNLSRSSYLLSKVVLLFLLSAFQTFLFVLIGNFILGIHGMFLTYWMVLFTVSCCANVVGLNISSAFDSIVTIYILIPLLLIPQMILGGAMFNYEKLNTYIGGGNGVPFVAEIIPARWAYEALMVEQFKSNAFENTFYELEKKESIYNYKRGVYLSHLVTITDDLYALIHNQKDNVKTQALNNKIDLLQNEIRKESKLTPELNIEFLDRLSIGKINNNLIDSLRQYLDELETLYSLKLNTVTNRKDLMLFNFQSNAGNTKAFRKFRDDYYNENLSDIVKKKYATKKLEVAGKEIIQLTDPIFDEPSKANLFNFRTHFFAPSKVFLYKYFDTFVFNLLILWFFILVLYCCLYFNLLRKVLEFRKNI